MDKGFQDDVGGGGLNELHGDHSARASDTGRCAGCGVCGAGCGGGFVVVGAWVRGAGRGGGGAAAAQGQGGRVGGRAAGRARRPADARSRSWVGARRPTGSPTWPAPPGARAAGRSAHAGILVTERVGTLEALRAGAVSAEQAVGRPGRARAAAAGRARTPPRRTGAAGGGRAAQRQRPAPGGSPPGVGCRPRPRRARGREGPGPRRPRRPPGPGPHRDRGRLRRHPDHGAGAASRTAPRSAPRCCR